MGGPRRKNSRSPEAKRLSGSGALWSGRSPPRDGARCSARWVSVARDAFDPAAVDVAEGVGMRAQPRPYTASSHGARGSRQDATDDPAHLRDASRREGADGMPAAHVRPPLRPARPQVPCVSDGACAASSSSVRDPAAPSLSTQLHGPLLAVRELVGPAVGLSKQGQRVCERQPLPCRVPRTAAILLTRRSTAVASCTWRCTGAPDAPGGPRPRATAAVC